MQALQRLPRDTSYCVRLDTGEAAPLPGGWWADEQQVSDDRRAELGVRRIEQGGAVVRLFDCRDPNRPVALGEPLILYRPVEAAKTRARAR